MKWLEPIHRFDLSLFRWCMALRRRELLTSLGRAVSKTADGYLYCFFPVVYALVNWPANQAFLRAYGIAFAAERVIYLLLKNSCRRHRPEDAIGDFQSFVVPSDKFSFPSGHTSAAFLFTVLVASQYPMLLPCLLLWASSVAVSRVFLGVHFPTDTVVGALLGTMVAFYSLSLGGVF